MEVYLAVNMTNSHSPVLLEKVIDHIRRLGHKVLNEHVAASTRKDGAKILVRNAGWDLKDLTILNKERLAILIRKNDFKWVRECRAFIGLFFGGSDGRGAEFEHLRLLMELERTGRGNLLYAPRCQGILGIFDRRAYSGPIWAADNCEKDFYKRVFVDPINTKAILHEIKLFLMEVEKKGKN